VRRSIDTGLVTGADLFELELVGAAEGGDGVGGGLGGVLEGAVGVVQEARCSFEVESVDEGGDLKHLVVEELVEAGEGEVFGGAVEVGEVG
jgi:hypothetical protein